MLRQTVLLGGNMETIWEIVEVTRGIDLRDSYTKVESAEVMEEVEFWV